MRTLGIFLIMAASVVTGPALAQGFFSPPPPAGGAQVYRYFPPPAAPRRVTRSKPAVEIKIAA